MTERTDPVPDLDAALADFTDRLLRGEPVELAPETEGDLRSLEEGALRLHAAFPPEAPGEKAAERLLSDFRARSRQRTAAPQRRWWSRQNRERIVVAFAAVLVLVVLVAAPLLLPGASGNLQGTATSARQDIVLLVIFTGVLIFLIWQGRRK